MPSSSCRIICTACGPCRPTMPTIRPAGCWSNPGSRAGVRQRSNPRVRPPYGINANKPSGNIVVGNIKFAMSGISNAIATTFITIRSNMDMRRGWRIGHIRAFIASCATGFIPWTGPGCLSWKTMGAVGNDVGHVLCLTYGYWLPLGSHAAPCQRPIRTL